MCLRALMDASHRARLALPGRGWLLMLCLSLGLLHAGAAAATFRGLPQVRHFTADVLQGAPPYSALAIDAAGLLYAGSSEGVMVFRSGIWEHIELPGHAAVYTLLASRDGGIYVGGRRTYGRLHMRPDGRWIYQDMLARLHGVDADAHSRDYYGLLETSAGVMARAADSLYLLPPQGPGKRLALPAGTVQRIFVVDDALYARIEGKGLARLQAGRAVPIAGGEVFARQRVVGVWRMQTGLLIAAADGLYASGQGGMRKLHTDVDAAFARHRPYAGIRLRDGSLVFTSFDGDVQHFNADFKLTESFNPSGSAMGVYDLAQDQERGLWLAGESGIMRMPLPSPWTVYDQRHGLGNRLYDSVWYDGQLWVAGQGLYRAVPQAEGRPLEFLRHPGMDPEMEVFALHGHEAGLLIADRKGLAVLDPGQAVPRRLVPAVQGDAVRWLLASRYDAGRVLGIGARLAVWLGVVDGRWQVLQRLPSGGLDLDGAHESGAGQWWLGDRAGGVQRWELDTATGQLLQHRQFGTDDGLPVSPGRATRVLGIGGQVYAINGAAVHGHDGQRFRPAVLPVLPGLERPWELTVLQGAQGTFAMTSRRVWWRPPAATHFRELPALHSKTPGYASLDWHSDGQLRLLARDRLLQWAPGVMPPAERAIKARLDGLQVLEAGGQVRTLPLDHDGEHALGPRAGFIARFGVDSVEQDVQFRYRLQGQDPAWSAWTPERELHYRLLPQGRYVLQVQARVRGGEASLPSTIGLRVQPLWFERSVVQIGLLALLALIIALTVRWRHRQVMLRNRELERRIAVRTDELEVANARLSALAITDGLTGIANRHALERALARGWQRCLHSGESLAVVMADVDRFKQFNDTHGHQAGDVQLQRVAAQFAREVAGVDELAARYGGEEFVLILPGLSEAAAMQRAERLRQRVARVLEDAGLPGSISLGVAAVVPSADSEPAALMRRADAALYRAKQAGRNRVERAGDPTLP